LIIVATLGELPRQPRAEVSCRKTASGRHLATTSSARRLFSENPLSVGANKVRELRERPAEGKQGAAKEKLRMFSKSPRRKSAPRKSARRKNAGRWSARVTRESDALDLEGGVFKLDDPKKMAASLKRSAERSKRRKSAPYRSALSMLVFYINRAGKNLPARRRKTLERAKGELRKLFGRA
jgi:hypothetical protein